MDTCIHSHNDNSAIPHDVYGNPWRGIIPKTNLALKVAPDLRQVINGNGILPTWRYN